MSQSRPQPARNNNRAHVSLRAHPHSPAGQHPQIPPQFRPSEKSQTYAKETFVMHEAGDGIELKHGRGTLCGLLVKSLSW